MKLGVDFYIQDGYKVFTKEHHLKKGRCCKNGCRHCPWKYKQMRNSDDLFIDMDGVLCDFEKRALEVIPHLAPEGTLERKEQIDDCQRIPDFYRNLEPIEGAIDGYYQLSEKYNIYILSAPSWDNPNSWSDKRLWVEEFLGDIAYKRLILTHNKGLFQGRALIDDRIKYGVDKFVGEHIHFGTPKFPNWESIINYLL